MKFLLINLFFVKSTVLISIIIRQMSYFNVCYFFSSDFKYSIKYSINRLYEIYKRLYNARNLRNEQ